jgi:hypothetical protein
MSTAEVVAERLPSLIQPVLAAASDAEAVRGMPSSIAKRRAALPLAGALSEISPLLPL